MNVNRKVSVSVLFWAISYTVTINLRSLTHPRPAVLRHLPLTLGVFAPTQLPLAVIEGILTVIIVIGLESYANRNSRQLDF